MAGLYLLPLGGIELSVLRSAEQSLSEAFNLEVKIDPRKIDVQLSYDSVRNQYHSAKLLTAIIHQPPPDALKVLGLIDLDLFLPIFTFLFGEAQLNGLGALLSTVRLHNRFYGLREDEQLFHQRLKKEAIHELGHTFGLLHCIDPACVMRSSTYVEEVDLKNAEFCRNCERKIQAQIPGRKRFGLW